MKRLGYTFLLLALFWITLFVGMRFNTIRSFLFLPPKQSYQSPLSLFKPLNGFPESALAHQLLDGLGGIEIGGSAFNSFGLRTLNVDYTDDLTTDFKKEEEKVAGKAMRVDIVAPGDQLPFRDNLLDFVITSHVIEHFYDPVKAVQEWLRVVKPGGYVYIIAPHKERTFDRDRPRTLLAEIIERHEHPNPPAIDTHHHYSVWVTQDFLDICKHYNWKVIAVQDVDDKVGNGFTVVIQKV